MLRHGLQGNNPILFPAIGTSPFLVRNILCNLMNQFDKFHIRDEEFIMCCLWLVVLDFTQGTSYQLVRYSWESTSRMKTTTGGGQSCAPTRWIGLARGLSVGIAARFVDAGSARFENMAKGTLWGGRENHHVRCRWRRMGWWWRGGRWCERWWQRGWEECNRKVDEISGGFLLPVTNSVSCSLCNTPTWH